MAGQREAEHKDRGYENLERQGLADKHTGSVQPPFSDGIGEVEKKYEKSSTREHSASEVTSRRQSAVDDLSKSERFQADNIVRRPISQMPASHTASNQYPGLDGDSHQPSEAKTMTHDQRQDVGNHRDEKPGASAIEEVLRNRAANQENQDANRASGGINERKQTYSRDSYESSGQAPVDEKRKEPYGPGETYSYVGRKDGQTDRKVAENRVLKSDKTDVVYPQKRDSSVSSESKNGLKNKKKKDETKVIEITVPSGSGQTHTVRGTVSGAAAVTAVAAALAAREAAKATSDAAKTATDKAEGMVMLKDASIMSASELAAYASAVNSAQAATQISGKQIADSYALAGQADVETIDYCIGNHPLHYFICEERRK